MIDSYFFIPADKPRFLNKMGSIQANYFVLDLEDSVVKNNKQLAFDQLMDREFEENCFVRIPFLENCYSHEQVKAISLKFHGRLVLPKISSLKEFDTIMSVLKGAHLRLVILVENPSMFMVLPQILETHASYIYGIGFGSHDFCSITGIKHSHKYLMHYKQQLVLYAKAYGIAYLDGVDLNLDSLDTFRGECLSAFEMGAQGKFMIHPRQLEALTEIQFLTEVEIGELQTVYQLIKDVAYDDMDVITLNGVVYERPHLKRIRELINKINTNTNSDL